jgi:hypothetical protein
MRARTGRLAVSFHVKETMANEKFWLDRVESVMEGACLIGTRVDVVPVIPT